MFESAPLNLSSVASVFDASVDCVKLIGSNGQLLWMNKGGLCAMEICDFNLFEGAQWSSLWPEEEAGKIRAALAADPPVPSHFTAYCPTAKATPRWWDVSVVPVDDSFGQHYGYIATSRDVTARETLAQNREIMLHEMRHRQKNAFALTASLCKMHAGRDPVLREFARDMSDRFAALSRAQSIVVQADAGNGAPLDPLQLLETLVRPCAGPECALSIDVADGVAFSVEATDAVGLILAELAVNSCKHGAFAHGGQVEVSVQPHADGTEILWTEESAQPVRGTSREGGQGMDLMRRVALLNDAVFDMDWTENGQRARLILTA